VASLLDITELKGAESALREAGRRKDEFLATLAHELRNPLAPIGYALEIMKLAGDDRERVENARETMERQLRHLVRLVDDLLDVSRITRGKLDLRTEPVEMGAVLDRAIEACTPLCEAAEHELTVTVPAEPVHLHADPVRLAQVFGNLINNACKYTPRRGHIRVSVERRGSEGVVTVADSGMGIEPEALSRVFDIFTQIDGSHERVQGGVGIGLTLAKGLVEMHGGTVHAFSEGLGQGSRFVVRLPVLAAESPERTADSDSGTRTLEAGEARGATTGRRVLVVEDDRESARSLSELLEMTGHEPHTVHDGAAAIARAEALRPDIVLLDIGLPKMNGYEVCQAIRRRPWGARTIVVALTGWGQDEDRRRTRDAGFDGHLVKPVEFDDLARFLRTAASEPGPSRPH
jgi:CheY-like chemotaxis protein/two-component sensor histidine kinase